MPLHRLNWAIFLLQKCNSINLNVLNLFKMIYIESTVSRYVYISYTFIW